MPTDSSSRGPFTIVTGASSSIGYAFAFALRNELKDSGVTVSGLMPGPIDTEFFRRADMMGNQVGVPA